MDPEPHLENHFLETHARLLIESYRRWTGLDLVDPVFFQDEQAKALFEASFALVSHGLEVDPIFNYGNGTALQLFEVDWETLTRMPSRESAERQNRDERARLLSVVGTRGYTDDYAGIRISSSGRRFAIEKATVWNVTGPDDRLHGQAAVFSGWKYL
jgi:hypothetical protein